jgi:hypothetical protein
MKLIFGVKAGRASAPADDKKRLGKEQKEEE